MDRTLIDLLLLQGGFNTTLVTVGAALLGAGAGVIGAFTLLRRQALISDAISHATLPGVALGFLASLALFGDGRIAWMLMLGALATGGLGILATQWIRDHTRLREDAAIGTVLSVFFGLGIVLLSHIQTLKSGGQAGLEAFLLGSTAAMTTSEAWLIAGGSAVVVLATLAMLKEFAAVCFDADHARALGWPVAKIDLVMTFLLLAVLSVGLKTVGLILIIALVIIPPVTARFWTERLGKMVALSGVFGAVACYFGAALSASAPALPTGSLVVLTAAAMFSVSLLLAPARGLVAHGIRLTRFRRRLMLRQALLRLDQGEPMVPRAMRRLIRLGVLDPEGAPTAFGRAMARDASHDHLLWTRYLARHPDEAFAVTGWGTRPITEVLSPDQVDALEAIEQ